METLNVQNTVLSTNTNITNTTNFTTMTLQLTKGQKLSDIASQINLTNNATIVSPTGSGKSYYVANAVQGKRVIVVPTQDYIDHFLFYTRVDKVEP